MTTQHDVRAWRGLTLVDRDGDKIGKIQDIYLDRSSGDPEWIAVKTGMFGSNVSFVPLRDATPEGDDIRVGFEKALVKDAPNVDPDGELSQEEERRLYQHYGRSDYDDWGEDSEDRTEARYGRDTAAGTTGRDTAGTTARETPGTTGRDTAGTTDRDTSGPGTGDAMTRSEEQLAVGTERHETGRARLRKYVETENVEQTVPVQREEVRVEREPITDANREAALAGPDISEAEHEVTLHSEEPVVEKRAVPKERVRLDKDVHTDEETVSDDVRRERIEAEGDAEGRL
jgi:uncharacterized protein (TIGR02271 family)